jgi:hypothetical protein
MPKMTPDQDKVARFQRFWQRAETDRPLIGATISTFPSVRAVRGDGILSPEDLDLAENLRELDEEWEQWREVMGDAIWSANPLWAFPWQLAIAGCPIERRDENLWGLAVLKDYQDLDRLRFDPSNPWFRRLMEFTQAIIDHSRGRYPVGVGELMLGPVDMMMQVRGQGPLALDFYDQPDMVKALGRRCLDVCTAAAEAQYAAVPRYCGGYAGTIRYFWAPDKLVEAAEDISFMTSLPVHREFIVPIHQGVGRRFPYTIVHLHSAQLHTVENLLGVEEIAAIEITPDFGEDLRPRLSILAQILERKPLIVHGIMSIEAMKDMIRALPSRGLCLLARCNSPAEGERVLKEVVGG